MFTLVTVPSVILSNSCHHLNPLPQLTLKCVFNKYLILCGMNTKIS